MMASRFLEEKLSWVVKMARDLVSFKKNIYTRLKEAEKEFTNTNVLKQMLYGKRGEESHLYSVLRGVWVFFFHVLNLYFPLQTHIAFSVNVIKMLTSLKGVFVYFSSLFFYWFMAENVSCICGVALDMSHVYYWRLIKID